MPILEERHKVVQKHVDMLFTKRRPLLLLYQEMAENLYPERADFTYQRRLGAEFADYLTTSVPALIRRDLANQIHATLRPPGQQWFKMTVQQEDIDNDSQRWLEAKTKVMMRAMSDRQSRFTRATKEADHDFAAFGQAVLSVEANMRTSTLLYRSWHLRDVVWCERYDGSIGTIGRKWKPYARDLISIFGEGNVSPQVLNAVKNNNGADAYKEINCLHIIVPSEDYDYNYPVAKKFPYISLFIDTDNKFVMEEKGRDTPYYIIPRWQTVSGSQYAYSPATVVALPDARLLQAITFTLLKAGEKAVDPPMIAVEEMVKSPIDIRAGGVIWVDADYDEKTGEVLRPMTVDGRGIPTGLNMQESLISTLRSAFYLDKLNLPVMGPEMTAYEVSQRIQEYIRQAIPLFSPIEEEYNAPLCEQTFQVLLKVGTFGSAYDIPPAIQGQGVRFKFESPLVEADDAKLAQTYNIAAQMIAQAAAADPVAAQMIDTEVALRDALRSAGTPAKWLRSEDDMAQRAAQVQQQQAAMQQAQLVEQQGNAGQSVGNAAATMQKVINGNA